MFSEKDMYIFDKTAYKNPRVLRETPIKMFHCGNSHTFLLRTSVTHQTKESKNEKEKKTQNRVFYSPVLTPAIPNRRRNCVCAVRSGSQHGLHAGEAK